MEDEGGAGRKHRARRIAERNPYYFKVDTAGNQLPYFDRINYALVADAQVLLLKCLQGEIDMLDQYIGTPTNKSVLYDGQAKGDYNFYTMISTEPNEMAISLNMTHPDKVKAELYSQEGLPRRPVARHRPAGADRLGLRRHRLAVAAGGARGRSALQ